MHRYSSAPNFFTATLLSLALASIFLTACASSFGGSVPLFSSSSSGQEIFAANCAVCHGVSGEGQPDWHIKRSDGTLPPPPLNGDGHTWHHGDGLLYRIISQGGKTLEDPNYPGFKSGMPAFGERLTHEETVEVIEYVKSLWGDKSKLGMSIRESQKLVSEQDPFPEGN
ncbi:MAG: cytochrome c [Chloroflexi bacterium]|nr:cytochrome c [Chloroflexota bacterium]